MNKQRAAEILQLAGDDLPDNPPEGFAPIATRSGFHAMMGQFYGKLEDGSLVCGFRCSPRHLNSNDSCHGGMIASFVDFSAYQLRLIPELAYVTTPTATLSVDYLRPVMLGDWVEARMQVTKHGKRLAFCRVTGTVDGVIMFTGTGIFVPGAPDPGGMDVLERVLGTA